MNPISRLQRWWRVRTGQIDTPFDGESPYWVVSMMAHLLLLIVLAACIIEPLEEREEVIEVDFNDDELVIEEDDFTPPQEFNVSDEFMEEIGAESEIGELTALSEAPIVADISEMPTEWFESIDSQFHLDLKAEVATGVEMSNIVVKGAVGEAATGAKGAIDQITNEILLQMNERPTTVVWLFDQSASLLRQRAEILERIDHVYEQLGVIEATGNQAFTKHSDKPLLTGVYAFGQSVTNLLPKPTDNLTEVKKAIASVKRDDSGIENVFSGIYTAAKKHAADRKINLKTRKPRRNVMLIVVTDEAGDDIKGLDPTIFLCRKLTIPVYVIGVPAPFGRLETPVKWVDPDPAYDQSPQWTTVKQGPESLAPERIRLHFSGEREDAAPIDSGFGPFALTRICYETGGIYFTVHPNRETNRRVSKRETDAYSAYFSYFFKPEVMKMYRPDYVTEDRYWQLVSRNKSRVSLVQTAQQSWVSQMQEPRLRFKKENEATFVNDITTSQQLAAGLQPQIDALYATLQVGEADREKESSLRWQASFDLAMGRVLAVKVRTESYNMMLAKAKTGLKFSNKKNNVWLLEPSDEITTGGQMKRLAEKATAYLHRVVDNHPGTPWALLAGRELETPVGWKWTEQYDPPPPPRPARPAANNNPPPRPRPARDDEARMLDRPKDRRPPPKL